MNKPILKNVLYALLMAAVLLVFIGVYLCVIKAGIPYQDQTIEMQIKWQAYYTAGTYNLCCGMVIGAIAAVGLILTRVFENIKGDKSINNGVN